LTVKIFYLYVMIDFPSVKVFLKSAYTRERNFKARQVLTNS
jgi:hypothetical protein